MQEKRLKVLCQHIMIEEVQQWNFKTWCDFCIVAGIGRDRRTAESWLRVASCLGMIRVNGGRYGPVITKGPQWPRYLDNIKPAGEGSGNNV